jgi:predicted dehydrogenase
MSDSTRRSFLQGVGLGAAALGLNNTARAEEKPIQGFQKTAGAPDPSAGYKPISDRKIRVGIAGYGFCKFGANFSFQTHPNVEVVAVTDLIPDNCAALAKECRCGKTYPSAEEMFKDDRIEAVFIATDGPSHGRLAVEAMKHGKHVATAVPAVYGSMEDADKLFEAVKTTGRKYMLFETSCYHPELHAMREIYRAGGFGKLVYSEGEYYHYTPKPVPSYKDWRVGSVPQWYPTHAAAFYVGVTGGSFTEVTCMGMPSYLDAFQPGANRYNNRFATEVALLRTSEGGMARIAMSWDTPGEGREAGRIRGQNGVFENKYVGTLKDLPPTSRGPLPPGVDPGYHGGSHGYLTHEFVSAIIQDRMPLVNIEWALAMTVGGIVAHQSALKDGELLKVPQYRLS